MSQKIRLLLSVCLLVLLSSKAMAQFQIESVVAKDVSCKGGNDGEITITVSGGEPPYTYRWLRFGPITLDIISSDETTVTFPANFPIIPELYFIEVSDGAGLLRSASVEVNEPEEELLVSISPDPAQTCAGADLQLTASASGGVPPYSHEWTGPGAVHLNATNIANPVFNSPVAGDYEITYTITDDNGCIISLDITVSNTESPTTDAGDDDTTCGNQYTLSASQSFGTGTWTASGPGSASFSSTSVPNATVTVSQPGVYTFTWTESADGCADSDDVQITFFENVNFTTNLTNPSAPANSDGAIQVIVSAGTAPFLYTLTDSDNNETTHGPTSDVSYTFTSLAEGTYNIEVSDVNGCFLNVNRLLSATVTLTVDVQTTATCGGEENGEIDIEILSGVAPFNVMVTTVPGGAAVFAIMESNEPNFTVNNLAAGTYNVFVEDDAGEIFSNDVSVAEGPFAEITYEGSPFCDDDEAFVTLTGFGGGTYSASPAGLVIDPATGALDLASSANGTYTVTYSYSDGTCSAEAQTQVVVGELSTVTISYDETPYCQETGGVATVTIDGQVLVSSSNTYTLGNIATDYNFRGPEDEELNDFSTCPGEMTVNIPPGSVITSVDVSYQMTAASGHYRSDQRSQLWVVSPGGEVEEQVYSGTGNIAGTQAYSRTGLTIANGVTGGGPVQFQLHAGRIFIEEPACNNVWNRVDNNTWTVTVHYTSGHEFVADSEDLDIDPVTGDINLETSLPGTYIVTYNYTEGGCTGSATTTVVILPKPEEPQVEDLIVCFDGEEHILDATAPDGASLVWYENETGFETTTPPTGTEVGEYTAWVAAVLDGCESDRVQATLTIVESPEMPTPINNIVCFDGTEYSAGATVADGDVLIWYTSEFGDELTTAPTAINPGTYTAWAAAENEGCESSRVQVTLVINDTPDAPEPINVTECFTGTELSASATPPSGADIIWYTTATGAETTTAPTAINPGTYTAWAASVYPDSGCESERVEVTLIIHALPEAEITYGGEIFCAEGIIEVTIITEDNIQGGAFSVNPEDGLDIGVNSGTINLGNSSPGTYEIEFRFYDDNFCFNTAYTTITIDDIPGAPLANDLEVCFDGNEHSADATPPAGATIVWYTSEFGDETTTAPTASAPGTYTAWAASVGIDTDCESERVLVTLIINDLPDAPTADDVTVCYDGTQYTATATAPAGTTLVWYADATGEDLAEAPTATEPGTYTAWAAAIDDITGCESERTLATLIINELPDAPEPVNVEACFDGTEHVASATPPAGTTLVWYTTQTGDVTTTAPTGTNPGTYTAWAAAVDSDTTCESERVLVTLTINDSPDTPIADDFEICFDGEEHSASAIPPTGASIVWYAFATGDEAATAPTGTEPGTYTAWAAAVDDITGCESDRVEVTLIIFSLPEAEISYGAESFCAEGIIEVIIDTEDNIVGGAFSVEPETGLDIGVNSGTINLTNSTPGTYVIEFRFYDENFCFNTAYTSITIDEIPDAPVANDLEVCFDGEEHTADATAPAGATIAWYTSEFGDETTTAPTASAPGTYTAWAASVGIDTDCESERVLVTLIINDTPDAPTTNDLTVCYDGTLYTASATVPAGTTLVWYADATGEDLASAPTGTEPGTYTAWAAAIDDITECESERTLVTLIINELPDAPEAINVEVCFDGTEHVASATPPSGTTLVWYTNQTGDVTTTAPTGTDPGTYTAWAAAVDNTTLCESERVEVTLVINDLPDAPTANDFEICYDGTEHSASATPAAGTSIVWYADATDDDTATEPTGTEPGTYTAWAAAVDDITGCESERVEVTLVIFSLPEAEITYGAENFCAEGTVEVIVLTDDNILGGAFSVEPETGLSIGVNSGTINLGNSSPGTYEIEYRFYDENFCFGSTKTTITINEGPALFITDVSDSDCAGEALGSISVEVTGGQLPYTFELLDEELNLIESFIEETNDFFTFTALQAGTYYVRVTDDNDCGSSISDALIIDDPDPITIDEDLIVIKPIRCFGEEDGEISLAANGGTGDLYYTLLLNGEEIQDPQTNNGNFTGLGEGVYVISITDDFSCGPVLSEEFTLIAPDAIAINAMASPDLVCQGDEAAIEVSVSQGNAPYQISLWFEGTQVGDPITAEEDEEVSFNAITQSGTYTILVNDADDCSNSVEVIISEPVELFVFNITGGGAYCAETDGVEIGLDGSETGINYTLLLDDESTGIVVEGTGEAISFGIHTEEGTYTVIATEPASLCHTTMAGSTDVEILPLPLVFNVQGGGDICIGEDGIEITLDGSEAGINYQLLRNEVALGDPVPGTGDAISFGSQETEGTYTVLAINPATLCENMMEGEAVINTYDRPIVYNVTGGGDTCPDSDGEEIGLDGSETGISYQLFLNGTEIGDAIAGTGEELSFGLFNQEGTYTILAVHPAGCDIMMEGEAVITLLPSPLVFEVQGGGEYCLGGEGMEITLDGSQTGVNYQLFLDENGLDVVEGTGNAISFGLQTQAGTYTVVATDQTTLCSALMAGNAVITITDPPVATITYPESPYCNTGFAEAVITGATGGTFSAIPEGLVIDAATGEVNLETSTPGTYTVTYDFSEGGCPGSASTTLVINENPAIVSITTTDAICANEPSGSITVEATGGELPYSIVLLDEDMAVVNTFEQTEAGEFTIENLLAGTYYIEVVDDNSCSSAVSESVTIGQPDAIIIDEDSLTYSQSLCEGETDGFISLVATGGTGEDLYYSLILNGDTIAQNTTGSFTDLVPGTYIVSITDELGCGPVESAPIVITENPLPLADAGQDRTICFGEDTQLGPETYVPGPVAEYFWTASPADETLEGQEEMLNPDVSPTVTTTYTLVETYVETGCVNTNTVVVTVVGGLPNAGIDQSICPGEEVTLGPETPIEGNVYTWTSSNPEEEFEANVPNPVVSPTETTTYTLVEEYTEFGCINTASVVITVLPAPQAITGPDTDICLGEEVTLGTVYSEPMPANTYLWTSEPEDDSISDTGISNPTVSPAVTTVYTLTETFVQSGCITQNSVVVTVHENPVAIVAEDSSVCGAQEIELGAADADPDLTYSWSSVPAGFTSNEANPTVTPGFMPVDENNQITFILEVSNEYCSDLAQVVITVIPAPVPDISDDLVFCSAEDAQNTPIGGEPVVGYTYLWESNQDDGFTSTEANPIVNPTVTTLYTVVVTDTLNGCSSTGYVLISISDLRFTRTGNPQVCEGTESVNLGTHIRIEGGMPPYQYFWSDADGNTISNELNPTVTAPFATSYNLLVLDQMNCPVNLTVQIQYIESPFVELYINNEPAGLTHSIFIGQTVIFEARPEGYDFYEFYILSEEPAEDNNDESSGLKSFFADIAPVQSGPSNVFTTNELVTGDRVFVIAYDGVCPGQSEMVIIYVNDLPNAFTPDGDGINDIFGQGADLTIFNRWGQRVYRGTNGWDGTFNGRKVSPGTYYYLLDIYDNNNRKTTIKGSVTVILQNQ